MADGAGTLEGMAIGYAVVLQTNVWTTSPVTPVHIEISAESIGVALSATGAI